MKQSESLGRWASKEEFDTRNSRFEIIETAERKTTLAHPVKFSGIAFHTGEYSSITLLPASCNNGVRFAIEGYEVDSMMQKYGYEEDHTTSAYVGSRRVQGVEHILSALHGLKIDNVIVLINNGSEIPVLDGSALQFANKILDTGIIEQEGTRRYVSVRESFTLTGSHANQKILARPSNGLSVDITIDFPGSIIGKQRLQAEIDWNYYLRSICAARTFIKDPIDVIPLAEARHRLRGLDECSVIKYTTDAYCGNLRFDDEPVRHKLLDFIGDIYTLGLPFKGDFVISKPGHKLNLQFCHAVSNQLLVEPPWNE